MKTCSTCGSTGEDRFFKKSQNLCLLCFDKYMETYNKPRDHEAERKKIGKNLEKFYKNGQKWLSHKSRDFMSKYHLDPTGNRLQVTRVDHSKMMGTISVIHPHFKRRNSE